MTGVTQKTDFDTVIIGGGVVGASIAVGLLKEGQSVAILDEGDSAIRASRGNFGLVWRQMKGVGRKPYADITKQSVAGWQDFASELRDLTGTDCAYRQTGGLIIAADEEEFDQFTSLARELKTQTTDGSFDYDIYGRTKLSEIYPGIGDKVPGAIFCADDGICNPLLLLRALHEAFHYLGGDYRPCQVVKQITPLQSGGFRVSVGDNNGIYECGKVVLAAGLGNKALAPLLGLSVMVSPVRGQILVTERVQDFDSLPCNVVRANEEGSLLIGASENNTGLDTSIDLEISAMIASRSIEIFPWLRNLQIVRMWSALRIMTPDGYPIYQQSENFPGAFVVTCHSGITLAAFHATELANAIVAGSIPATLNAFKAERFNV